MIEYYIIRDNVQVGPFDRMQLIAEGLTPQTMVWRAGMDSWQQAQNLPELHDLLYGSLNDSVNGTVNGHLNGNGLRPMPYNWRTLAILAIVLGLCTSCIGSILGIIGLVFANRANANYANNNFSDGDANNSSAKTFTIIALVLDALAIIGSFIYCMIVFL